MPVTYTNSMAPTQVPAFRKSFKWVDDPGEDGDFVAFIREQVDQGYYPNPPGNEAIRALAVDRTSAPAITWEIWEYEYDAQIDDHTWQQTGTGSRTIGPSGTIWRQATWLNSAALRYLGPFPMTGYWECDQYGRAFSIDDLVAP